MKKLSEELESLYNTNGYYWLDELIDKAKALEAKVEADCSGCKNFDTSDCAACSRNYPDEYTK